MFVPAPPRIELHDPNWADRYAAEALLISQVWGKIDHSLEHIGSTAIADLPAKPVIDVMLGVSDYDRFEEIRTALEGVGYLWDPDAERDEPARKVFRKGPADMGQLRSHTTCIWPSRAGTTGDA